MVDRLKQEFDIDDTWLSYEIHPDTPPQGIPLSEYFPGMDVRAMHAGLRRRAAEFDLPFGDVQLLANSRLAALGGEFARDEGRHHDYAMGMFAAYFARGENIGDVAVVLRVAEQVGLDPAQIRTALAEDRHAERLAATSAEARRWAVTGVPTFVVNDSYRVVGAQPLQVFRELLGGLQG